MAIDSPRLLRDLDYRQLFASTTVSQFGVHLTMLALPLVAIISLEASPFEVGLLGALLMAPFLLVGLPAGALVDRMRRRLVLIVGDLGNLVEGNAKLVSVHAVAELGGPALAGQLLRAMRTLPTAPEAETEAEPEPEEGAPITA